MPEAIDAPSGATLNYVASPANSPQIQPDGRALGIRTTLATGRPVRTVVRLRSDGTLDPTFALLPDVNAPRLESGLPDLNFPSSFSLPDGTRATLGANAVAGDGKLWAVAHAPGAAPRLVRFVSREVDAITAQPRPSSSIVAGRDMYLQVALGTTQAATYQWYFNDSPIAGADGPLLWLSSVRTAQAGRYSVRVGIGGKILATNDATVTVAPNTARLVNFSARSCVAPGAPQIVGVVVNAPSPQPVLLRAVGPSLPLAANAILADPNLALFGGDARVAQNDDWSDNLSLVAGASQRVGAFALDSNSKDAATVVDLASGIYTGHCSSKDGGSGIGLFEVYDASTAGRPGFLQNVSLRSRTAPGLDTMIGGFVVAGDGPLSLLIRAVGSELTRFAVPGALANPRLTLVAGAQIAASNDDWENQDAAVLARIVGAIHDIGTFPLDPGGRSAALLVALEPGLYTVHASGADGGAGEVLLECYVVTE